jgi:hypothetical protein
MTKSIETEKYTAIAWPKPREAPEMTQTLPEGKSKINARAGCFKIRHKGFRTSKSGLFGHVAKRRERGTRGR